MVGLEPAGIMAQMALATSIAVIYAKAEAIPFYSQSFEYAAMITSVCFLDDISKAFAESYRIIKNKGFFIVARLTKTMRQAHNTAQRKLQVRGIKVHIFILYQK